MIAASLLQQWEHVPHWLRALVLGNLLQGAFVALLRLLLGRFRFMQPVIDRIGPKALRTRGSKGEGLVIGVVWLVLSWYVGRRALRARADVIGWILRW